uniref:TPX2 central domain-containing protein n=1 Tax=Timema poppense TaxID=170557 RepID=A0A7R9DDQ5_TIMPO|nr:unnamed protein product [Timema poppensis]
MPDPYYECASTVKILENPRHQLVDVGNSPELRESKPEEQMEQSLCEILDRVKINENGTKKKNSTPMRIAGPSTTLSSRKEHHMLTRLDKENTPLLSLRSRNVERSLSSAGKVMKTNSSKKNVTQKASQPSCSQPRVTSQLTSFIGSRKRQHSPHVEQPHKYISLAEAVLNFQRCTPRRFHSRKTSLSASLKPILWDGGREGDVASQPTKVSFRANKNRLITETVDGASYQTAHNSKPHKPWVFKSTIPVTPGLTSHLRTRPVHYPTREQEEEAAFMEMKKHQVKAYPLNTDIFKQPKLGIRVEAKQHTIPEPFNLTELKKKEVLQSPQFVFKARPISKGIMENVKGIPEKKPLPATKPVTPKVIKRRIPLKVFEDSVEVIDGKMVVKPQEVFHFGVPQVSNKRSTPSKRMTEVKPFSFEKRDIELQKKKDEKIKAVFEQEKKARIFHANPVPQLCQDLTKGLFTDVSSTTNKSQDESMKSPFRARPAKVLNQKPFVPKPADRRPLIPLDLVLNTESRSKVREEFNQYLKERDDHIEQLRAEVS